MSEPKVPPLVNVEQREALPLEERETIAAGQRVKVLHQAGRTEVWVEVTDRADQGLTRRYAGRVDLATTVPDIKVGDKILFGPQNVAEID